MNDTSQMAQESAAGNEAILRVLDVGHDISTRHSRLQVLRGVRFDLCSGEVLGVLGPNGCGKTTLLRAMARLLTPTTGAVEYRSVTRIGMIFQSVQQNLVPWRTVLDNVALHSILGNGARNDMRDSARRILDALGVGSLADRYPHEISGGQQQLAIIARWLASPPDVLLVDEGWSMLDIVQRERAAHCLKSIARNDHAGVCVVSHNVSELAALADRVIILSGQPASVAHHIVLSGRGSRAERSELLWQAANNVFGASS